MERRNFTVTMHFFKVMMPGFHQKLKLPTTVSKEIERQKSQRAILQSRLGTWKISLCRNFENDLICLSEGWPQFVDRHALRIGDFLVFEHTGDLHFNVSVFDSSACEKEYRDEPKKAKENITHRPKKTSIEEAEKQSTCFVKTMVPQYATKGAKVTIPTEFMRSNSLSQQTSVALRDPKGRAWTVTLTSQKRRGIRLRMCGGWHEFYTFNGLKDGDTCVFKLKCRLLTPTTIFFDVHIFPALAPL